MNSSFNHIAALRTMNLLDERKALIHPSGTAFWVWPREDRLILIFDPEQIDLGKVSRDFGHRLSTRLQGRQVVRTNSRCLVLQIAYDIPPALVDLTSKPLNLSEQPTPYHMPIGSTYNGDLWRSLLEGDSFFVVGLRGMGKTAELHGMIQALLHGGQTLVYAWDGKENAEYLRYVGRPNFTLLPMDGLQRGLAEIQAEATLRYKRLATSGHPNIIDYNANESDRIPPIALFIDEVAEVDDQALLLKQVKVNRAAGVYPVFATNDPSKAAVVAKSNLGTRISFKVVSPVDSLMGLGRPGANRLPSMQGRGLIEQKGKLIEFQSFTIPYPKPSEAGMQWLAEQTALMADSIAQQNAATEDEKNRILELAKEGKSAHAIVAELYGLTSGRPYTRKLDEIKAITSTSATSALFLGPKWAYRHSRKRK